MSVLLMEPASSGKRRHQSDLLLNPDTWLLHTPEDVKKKLREIRDYSLNHIEELLGQLNTNPSFNAKFQVNFAQDAQQAAKYISEIAGGTTLAINKSSVIKNELVPVLTASSHYVVDSYDDEFATSDVPQRECWELSAIPLESRLQCFSNPVNLTALRSAGIQENGSKDFIALVGVNAVSASDGTVLLFQHMHNISKIVEQSKELVLVAGIDKIMRSPDDAVFQTMCMAIFGCETLPLTLGSGAKQNSDVANMPYSISQDRSTQRIHLILLDNGRSSLVKSPYRELLACIDCLACLKNCPASPFFADGARLSPRQYIYSYVLGRNSSLDRCLQCQSCRTNCPLDIDLPGLILEAKTEFAHGKHRSLINNLLANAEKLQSTGSSAALFANALSGNRPLRWTAEKIIGISSKRRLPKFQHRTLIKRFKSMSKEAGKHE